MAARRPCPSLGLLGLNPSPLSFYPRLAAPRRRRPRHFQKGAKKPRCRAASLAAPPRREECWRLCGKPADPRPFRMPSITQAAAQPAQPEPIAADTARHGTAAGRGQPQAGRLGRPPRAAAERAAYPPIRGRVALAALAPLPHAARLHCKSPSFLFHSGEGNNGASSGI